MTKTAEYTVWEYPDTKKTADIQPIRALVTVDVKKAAVKMKALQDHGINAGLTGRYVDPEEPIPDQKPFDQLTQLLQLNSVTATARATGVGRETAANIQRGSAGGSVTNLCKMLVLSLLAHPTQIRKTILTAHQENLK